MLIGLFWITVVGAQILNPVQICVLPSQVNESSGLELLPNGHYLTHNDGGWAREIYEFDATCNLVRTVYLDSINQVDIEDISIDDSGNVYVGDFGNNNTLHGRTDLVIYKIDSLSFATKDTIIPEFIHFSYSDQTDFSPPPSERIYDCEAMVHHGDSLYLFSKNDATATNTYTRVYALSDQPGTYVAQLRDSLNTGGRINAASYNHSLGQLIMSANDLLWKSEGFTAPNWFSGLNTQYVIPDVRKYEGALLLGDGRMLLSTDTQGSATGELYEMLEGINFVREKDVSGNSLYPNPFVNELTVEVEEGTDYVQIMNGVGQTVFKTEIHQSKMLIAPNLVPGVYHLSIWRNGKLLESFKLVKS